MHDCALKDNVHTVPDVIMCAFGMSLCVNYIAMSMLKQMPCIGAGVIIQWRIQGGCSGCSSTPLS